MNNERQPLFNDAYTLNNILINCHPLQGGMNEQNRQPLYNGAYTQALSLLESCIYPYILSGIYTIPTSLMPVCIHTK